MPRIVDITLTILFLLYFSFYDFLGLLEADENHNDYLPFVCLTSFGLFLIVVSIFIKKKRTFSVFRFSGIILSLALLFWDLKRSFSNELENKIAYLATIILLIYAISSIMKIKTFNKVK